MSNQPMSSAVKCSVEGCAHPVFAITPTLAAKLPPRSVVTRCAGCPREFRAAALDGDGLCVGCRFAPTPATARR